MSYVHDDQYASLLGRCVRNRAVLVDRSCGVSEVSILGEYLQRVKAERDEMLKLLRRVEQDGRDLRGETAADVEELVSRYVVVGRLPDTVTSPQDEAQ
jgi:hypothetical protein